RPLLPLFGERHGLRNGPAEVGGPSLPAAGGRRGRVYGPGVAEPLLPPGRDVPGEGQDDPPALADALDRPAADPAIADDGLGVVNKRRADPARGHSHLTVLDLQGEDRGRPRGDQRQEEDAAGDGDDFHGEAPLAAPHLNSWLTAHRAVGVAAGSLLIP